MRVPKPISTKVTLENYLDEHVITILSPGWNANIAFLLFFTVFWNSMLVFFITTDAPGKIALFTPFIVAGLVVFFIFLYSLLGKTIVVINRDEIRVSIKLFNLEFKRKRTTANLERIDEDIIYLRNKKPVYGIVLFFREEKKISFGTKLSEEERKWLKEELNYLLEKKVGL